MKTSLLLQREPFAKIFCNTLQKYWLSTTGKGYEVCWFENKLKFRKIKNDSWQIWYGNTHLNFFATKQMPAEGLSTLQKEYGRSVSSWRSIPQEAYVKSAMSKKYRNIFAQVAIGVKPYVETATRSFVLAGNRRIRIVYPFEKSNTVILKDGYPDKYLRQEVGVRENLNLDFVPKLEQFNLEGGWYQEAYFDGIPLNRLPIDKRLCIEAALNNRLLSQLVLPTLENEVAYVYFDRLFSDIQSMLSMASNYKDDVKKIANFLARVNLHVNKLFSPHSEIPISMTHGDFQQGNILVNNNKFKVIDWESVSRRHVAYDMLVYNLGSRRGTWYRGVERMFDGELFHNQPKWPGLSTKLEIKAATLAFLLEELQYYLVENFEVSFRRACLKSLLARIAQLYNVLAFID
ncbi:MAG: phosphotransferase [Coxiellaceae bacterium]|nr:phosphotransferase [Coxiellaceae bacterium]